MVMIYVAIIYWITHAVHTDIYSMFASIFYRAHNMCMVVFVITQAHIPIVLTH